MVSATPVAAWLALAGSPDAEAMPGQTPPTKGPSILKEGELWPEIPVMSSCCIIPEVMSSCVCKVVSAAGGASWRRELSNLYQRRFAAAHRPRLRSPGTNLPAGHKKMDSAQ